MADYRVRFIGDLGNLAAFNSSIRGALSSNSRSLQSANSGVVSRALGGAPIVGPSRSGFSIRNASTELDHYNNALRQSGTVVRQFVQGYKSDVGSLGGARVTPIFGETFHTDFNKAIANLQKYGSVVAQLAPVDAQINQMERAALTRAALTQNAGLRLQQVSTLGTKDTPITEEQQLAAQKAYKSLQTVLPSSTLTGLGITGASSLYATDDAANFDAAGTQQKLAPLFKSLKTQEYAIRDELRRNIKEIQNDPVVRSLSQSAYYSATNPEGYVGAGGVQALSNPAIRNDLIKKTGLGAGAPFVAGGTDDQNLQFMKNAEAQGFKVTNVYKDLERNITHIQGEIMGAGNVMQKFTYAIDNNGNAINSWGRNLSGSRGFLSQTGRDLLKFTEWMAAATLVMGGFQVAIGALSTINELNANLQRLAITLQLNATETNATFLALSDVAIKTATPLQELVKASDDIALATRRANQTTQEWKNSFIEMATAVGILTNISGLDTVKATDLLTASMKQLSLTTGELIPLLNQVTAAAGGQANSIADIITAIGSVSEAATEALVTPTQQIAAVQVISQVTGKSAADTATAFKNLFGAINSAGAIKELKLFGIEVRDAEGNLKPFLDIYKEISDKISKGIIPQGRINEVLRAISGGPRRSPDAAALLANINKVFDVTTIAANATNEALVANAEILTTNRSKMIQFKNAWDTAIFEKFNKVIQDIVGTLTGLGIAFSTVFSAIPSSVIGVAVQVIALAGAFALLSKVGGTLGLGKLFGGAAASARELSVAAGLASSSLEKVIVEEVAVSGIKISPQVAGQLLQRGYEPGYLNTVTPKEQVAYLNKTLNGPIIASSAGVPIVAKAQDTPFYQDANGRYRYSPLTDKFGPEGNVTNPTLANRPVDKATQAGLERLAKTDVPAAFEKGGTGFVSKLTGFYKNLGGGRGVGLAAGAGLVGAGLGLATSTGQSANQTGASVAQFGAFGAFLAGGPAGILVGGLLTGASILLQSWAQKEEDAKKTTDDLEKSLFTLTETWKTNNAGIAANQQTYDDIQKSLSRATVGTAEYVDLQAKLGIATVDLNASLATQNDSLQSMIPILTKLNELHPDQKWGDFLQGLGTAGFSKDELTQLSAKLSGLIFQASGQPGVFSSNTPASFDASKLSYYSYPTTSPVTYATGALTDFSQKTGQVGYSDVTAAQLSSNLSLVKTITDLAQSSGGYNNKSLNFPVSNPELVLAFRTGLNTLLAANQIQQSAVDQFEAAVTQFGVAQSVAQQVVGANAARIQGDQAVGLLSGQESTDATRRNLIAQALLADAAHLTEPIPTKESYYNGSFTSQQAAYDTQREQLYNQANAIGSDGKTYNKNPLDKQTLIDFADAQLKATGQLDLFKEPVSKGAAEIEILRNVLHLTDEQLKKLGFDGAAMGQAVSSAIIAAKEATQSWADGALKSAGDKLLQLQARAQGGEFLNTKDNPNASKEGKFLFDQANATIAGIKAVTKATLEAAQATGGDMSNAATTLGNSLDKLGISGFQGLTNNIDTTKNSIENLNTGFFNMLSVLNLSGPEVAKAIQEWAIIIQEAVILSKIMDHIVAGDQVRRTPRTPGPGNPTYDTLAKDYAAQLAADEAALKKILGTGTGTKNPFAAPTKSSTASTSLNVGTIFLSAEQQKLFSDPQALIKQAYADALKLQAQIPGEKAKDKNDVVAVFNGLNKIFQERGLSETLLRKALDDLTAQMAAMNAKADTVRRVRVGAGDFSAIANVPVNAATGVSVAGNNQINITFNLNGSTLTPANMDQLADKIGAVIARNL